MCQSIIDIVEGEQENVLLCFEMDKAPTAVIQAEAVESYDDLEDELDKLAAYRPQRHNIVFTDGWPINSWYSTEAQIGRASCRERV